MVLPPIFSLVGRTPLLQLTRLGTLPEGVRVYAKAEFMNPGGSVKDRAAAGMILDGMQSGHLPVSSALGSTTSTGIPTIIDATSGNTGIALAMIGAAIGVPVSLVMPENTSPERKAIMRDCDATVIDDVSAAEGSDGAFLAVREIVAKHPARYFYPDQYNNPANPRAHELGTGAEIWDQTHGEVTHFVAAMGTSGTFTGSARRLKHENPRIRTIAVQPDSPLHGIEGTKHMASTIRPSILDESLIDEVKPISTEASYAMTRQLARREGLFCGVSSGANVAASLDLAQNLPPGSTVVTVLPDSGTRYLGDRFWDETEDSH
ncbi:PLP-dependent cysteine synthase family protein [Propionibacterium sp.]|uniref:PLP-dependent cysteine synthase family protein n=1 Tax=Propionibacterium sp. TaxID=1977903 RepID=UPI0039EC3850